jgi:capsular polysaccharide biosynthesis protein
MELRQFWTIFRRRWPLVVVPALIVLALGLLSYRPAPPAYNAGVRFIVGQPPIDGALTDEQRYYNWLTSEYIVNGLTDWVRGGRFAEAVAARIEEETGNRIAPQAIQSGMAVDNARSMLTVSITAGDFETTRQIMNGVILVMTEENAVALPQLGGETAVLTQLDDPVVTPISAGLRSQIDLPLRVALALFAGAGLALLAHYLDPTVRDRAELERLGIPLAGEIPGERRSKSRGIQ